MKNSEELFERAKLVAPGGVHSPVRSFRSVGGTPVFFKSAKGAHLYDVDGKDYIDFCLSFGPMILGHRDDEIEEVVKETVSTAWSFGACEPYSLELAEFIVNEIPEVEKIRFVNSGTEAVMSALRVARAATGREKILKFDGCYHGHLDSLLVKSGSGLAGESSSDSAGIGKNQYQDTLVLKLDDESSVEKLFSERGKEIACLVIEPLPANYGLLIQRKSFIESIVKIAKKNGTIVLFDEVISGFRVSMKGMAEHFEEKPDLITYGKIIGGGFPVGAYAGRKDLMDLVAPAGPVYQAGTLSGNPIGMRAGLAVLKKLKEKHLHIELANKTAQFTNRLEKLINENSEKEISIARFASIFWIHEKTNSVIRKIDDIPETHKENFAKLFHKFLANGIYLAPSGYEVGFFSTAHNERIMDRFFEKAEKALKD